MKQDSQYLLNNIIVFDFSDVTGSFRKQDGSERAQTNRNKETNVDSAHYSSDKGGFVDFTIG